MIKRVAFSKDLTKAMRKGALPMVALKKLKQWADDVTTNGLQEARKRVGYHDEPLSGDRKGQRSVRLSQQWRAIYVVQDDGVVEFVEVQEVTPHAY